MVVKTQDYRALAEKSRSIKRKSKPKKSQPRPAAVEIAPPHDEQSTRAYLIAQEIKFAKVFAGNDTKVSEKQLKRLRRWLKIRSASSFRKYYITYIYMLTILNHIHLQPYFR